MQGVVFGGCCIRLCGALALSGSRGYIVTKSDQVQRMVVDLQIVNNSSSRGTSIGIEYPDSVARSEKLRSPC